MGTNRIKNTQVNLALGSPCLEMMWSTVPMLIKVSKPRRTSDVAEVLLIR